MSESNFTQASFLGGEWSPAAQGRSDLPTYRTALNQCQNAIPIEEGSAVRRPGTPELGLSYFARPGVVRRFEVADNTPVQLEITFGSGASALRFWWYDGFKHHLVHNDQATVTSISTASPAVMTISGALGAWSTGDIVFIQVDQSINSNIGPQLANRQFVVTNITSTTYSLVDMLTGANLDGSTLNATTGLGATVVKRALIFSAPFASLAEVQNLDFVQADTVAYFLTDQRMPWVLTLTNPGNSPPAFTFVDAGFGGLDGPYLDPLLGASQTFNSKGSVTGGTGTINFACTDGAYTFTSADVGRCIRMFNQPPLWVNGTTYANGDQVTWNKVYYKRNPGAAAGTPQDQPGAGVPYYDSHTTTVVLPWQPIPTLANWAYGKITALVNSSTVTVVLGNNQSFPNYSASGPITDTGNGPVIDTWQLGAYTTGHTPSCGTYHEGRLWMSGAYPNRFDASMPIVLRSDGSAVLQFSPTDLYGQVAANNAINYTVRGQGVNKFRWMTPDHQGILCGTQSGEWLIASSNLSNPLTPTDIQAKRTSAYKGALAKPIRVGNAIIFIQASLRRVIEYVADVFSGKFIGRHLNKFAKHLTPSGFRELSYQEELAPIIWSADNTSGLLVGCTYRRTSNFGSEEPAFMAWHKHPIAGRKVISLSSGATNAGILDTLAFMSQDANGKCFVHLMAPIFDAADTLAQSRHLDCYYTGNALSGFGGVSGYDPSLYGGSSGIKLNGMANKAGQTVTVTIAGLDCGDYTVAADGSVTLAYGCDPDGLLTAAYLTSIAGSAGDLSTTVEVNNGGKFRLILPVLVGSTYTTQAQIVRPELQQEVRSETGPGLGKTRRVHRYALKLVNTQGVSIGTGTGNLRPVPLTQANAMTALPKSTLFTGVVKSELDDDYSFDGMVMLQITRPYPCTVASVGVFLDTAAD